MLDRDKLMLQARSKLGRNLTPDEWTQYFSASEPYHRTFPDLPVFGEGEAPAEGEAGQETLHLTETAQSVPEFNRTSGHRAALPHGFQDEGVALLREGVGQPAPAVDSGQAH
jgi:hypothetical protein